MENRKNNISDLELKIGINCAPVILGIKSANTITVQNVDGFELCELLKETGVEYVPLYQKEKTIIYLIYRSSLILETLKKPDIRELLKRFGYYDMDMDLILTKLKRRYELYMKKQAAFPHEIGLILDYPPEDVISFMNNNGQQCRLCGYWKVYGDVEQAKYTFSCYDRARELVLSRIRQGESLKRIAAEIA